MEDAHNDGGADSEPSASTPQRSESGEGGRRHTGAVSDHTDVTPHTLAPEDYHKALSSEPGLYTIGTVAPPFAPSSL